MSDQGFTMTERQARLDRDLAEAESFRAQAERDRWQAEYNRHSAAQQEASTQDTLSSAAFRGAADVEHRTYHLIGEINEASAHACAEFLSRWARQSPVTPVGIVLSTFGGDVFPGMALVDTILALRANGLPVTITVRGTAASMGAILLQAADRRIVGPSSTLLIHKISTMVAGSLDQIEDMQTWLKIVQEQAVDMFADRCASAPSATKPLTRAQVKACMNRKDWAIGPGEAVALGLADEVG